MTLERLFRVLVWALALVAAASFLFLAAHRVPYPLELDYIEGALLDHVARLAAGQSIFVEPSMNFITLAYMPGYTALCALVAQVTGVEFWVPRAISLLSMLLLALLVVRVIRRETGDTTLGVAGAGLLLAAYGVTGGHYDVGRADSLMLLLAFGGLAMLRLTNGMTGAIGAGLLLTAAFFTKQHAVWFVIAALMHLLVSDRMRLWPFLAVVLLGCGGGYFVLSAWLGPWFQFFTWEVPSHWSTVSHVRILNYLGRGMVGTFGVLTTGVLASLALPDRPWRGPSGLWYWAGLGGLATGLMATLDPDAFRHVLNPSVVALSILGPLALHSTLHHVATWPGQRRGSRPALLWVLLALQFLPLYYSARGHLPRSDAQQTRTDFIEKIRGYPGRVLMLYHGSYTRIAGKGTTFQQIALDDIIRARGNRLLRDDPTFMDRVFAPMMAGSDRPVIITDVRLDHSGIESRAYWQRIAPSYVLVDSLRQLGARLNPVDGNHWTPRFVYAPPEKLGAFPDYRGPGPAAADSSTQGFSTDGDPEAGNEAGSTESGDAGSAGR
ncbi:MAG: hypothetical protein HOP12_00600 [Candidatus Eisenbacteria bacterium]|uniref:Glycosyltransferase RgtA/B/C/D-like domain-containing protein n=1 Tax=Eiseniibacteriota bacterium TaxID=2212470 RepID=A0A849SDU3_UNCEI|nr:hypothetical protein [Candidatus Eisenbacteria bacterium]